MTQLILDPNIRNYVVLPLVVIMIFVNMARNYVSSLLRSDKTFDADEIKYRQVLQRASMLRSNGGFLTASAYAIRKGYFISKEDGKLFEKVPKGGMNMAAMNPMAMMDMMKGNITFIVPNMIMMNIIQQFFQGFVLVKIPFPLTNRFKTMLQRGVDLSTLDVTYTSSLSWYFLLMFGLRGVIKLVMGEEDSGALDEGRAYQMQMGTGLGAGGGGPPGAFNAEGAYKGNREMLEIHRRPTSLLDDVEKRLLGARWPAERTGFNSDDEND